MSQENLEVVRRFWETSQRFLDAYWQHPRGPGAAVNAEDLDSERAALLACLHPEVD